MKHVRIVMILLLAAFLFGCGNSQQASAPAAPAAPATPAAPVVQETSIRDLVTAYIQGLPNNANYMIPAADFVKKAIAGEQMLVLDIRRADDYNAGHIKGSVNIPWGTPAMWETLERIPRSGEIYVTCYTGQTAGQAVVLYNLAGVPARSIQYGWNRGISKVEGYQAAVGPDVGQLPTATYPVAANVMAAYRDYYQSMPTSNDLAARPPRVANNILADTDAKLVHDAKDPSVQFVSVRRAADYAAGHIEGAMNMPFGASMVEMIPSLPADKTLIVYCYTGQTSGQTVAALRLLGFNAISLNSGMGNAATAPAGWSNRGYPVVAKN